MELFYWVNEVLWACSFVTNVGLGDFRPPCLCLVTRFAAKYCEIRDGSTFKPPKKHHKTHIYTTNMMFVFTHLQNRSDFRREILIRFLIK